MIRPGHRERGMVALEMVFVLVLGVLVLAVLVLFGRLTMHMIVMEKAVGNTTRIVATLPRTMLVADNASQNLMQLGGQLIFDMAVSAGLDTRPDPRQVTVLCDNLFCSSSVDVTFVSVGTSISFRDPVFRNYTRRFLPSAGTLSLQFSYSQLCVPATLPTP